MGGGLTVPNHLFLSFDFGSGQVSLRLGLAFVIVQLP